jgi:CrcB protein
MTPLVFIAVAVAGGLGAACRLFIDGIIRTRTKATYPIATMVINVSGSLLLGVATGLLIGGVLPQQWHLIVGGGFLGGYTTFSTASFESVRLLQERRYLLSALNGLGMLVLSVAAAALGLWLGSLA